MKKVGAQQAKVGDVHDQIIVEVRIERVRAGFCLAGTGFLEVQRDRFPHVRRGLCLSNKSGRQRRQRCECPARGGRHYREFHITDIGVAMWSAREFQEVRSDHQLARA
ncbi:MAG: hypothetical protein AAFU65_13755, partial [Pseudomonadota bacterium]